MFLAYNRNRTNNVEECDINLMGWIKSPCQYGTLEMMDFD